MQEASKIIHQTWKTKDVPEEWKESQEKWKDLYPDYEYKLWTDEDNLNFIKNDYPEYLDMFLNYKYNIQRADVIRYFILQKYGGIYSDLDIVPIKKIPDNMFTSGVMLMRVNNISSNPITNALMVSNGKNNPFWKSMIDEAKKRSENLPWYIFGKHNKVIYSTGPHLISSVAENYKEPITLLPKSISICGSCAPSRCLSQTDSYITMLEGKSWHGIDSTLYNFIFCNKEYVMVIILLFIIYYIYKYHKNKQCCLEGKQKYI